MGQSHNPSPTVGNSFRALEPTLDQGSLLSRNKVCESTIANKSVDQGNVMAFHKTHDRAVTDSAKTPCTVTMNKHVPVNEPVAVIMNKHVPVNEPVSVHKHVDEKKPVLEPIRRSERIKAMQPPASVPRRSERIEAMQNRDKS